MLGEIQKPSFNPQKKLVNSLKFMKFLETEKVETIHRSLFLFWIVRFLSGLTNKIFLIFVRFWLCLDFKVCVVLVERGASMRKIYKTAQTENRTVGGELLSSYGFVVVRGKPKKFSKERKKKIRENEQIRVCRGIDPDRRMCKRTSEAPGTLQLATTRLGFPEPADKRSSNRFRRLHSHKWAASWS
jgi:hypothetical protein